MESPPVPPNMRAGVPYEVAPGVQRIVAPNPGMMTGPGTNTYVLGTRRLALIDPGPDDDAHLVALLEAVGDRLDWILVTHTHIDHAPLASRLKEATGAQIVAFGPAPPVTAKRSGDEAAETSEAHDRAFHPDRLMFDGERIDSDGFAVDAVHTPGHTSNHLCFGLAGSDLLFSGDHVMSGSTVVIAPPDGDMTIYMESLEKVQALRPARIAPGHGDMIDDPARVLDEYLRHRRGRELQILSQLRAAPGTEVGTKELVDAIYAHVPEKLHRMARLTVWAHLRKLRIDGLTASSDPDDPDARWTAPPPSVA